MPTVQPSTTARPAPPLTPQPTVKELYHQALKLQRAMDRQLDDDGKSDAERKAMSTEWYRLHESINPVLHELLRLKFTSLTKPKLINFLNMCGSYRPVQPHMILIYLKQSNLEETNEP